MTAWAYIRRGRELFMIFIVLLSSASSSQKENVLLQFPLIRRICIQNTLFLYYSNNNKIQFSVLNTSTLFNYNFEFSNLTINLFDKIKYVSY